MQLTADGSRLIVEGPPGVKVWGGGRKGVWGPFWRVKKGWVGRQKLVKLKKKSQCDYG